MRKNVECDRSTVILPSPYDLEPSHALYLMIFVNGDLGCCEIPGEAGRWGVLHIPTRMPLCRCPNREAALHVRDALWTCGCNWQFSQSPPPDLCSILSALVAQYALLEPQGLLCRGETVSASCRLRSVLLWEALQQEFPEVTRRATGLQLQHTSCVGEQISLHVFACQRRWVLALKEEAWLIKEVGSEGWQRVMRGGIASFLQRERKKEGMESQI